MITLTGKQLCFIFLLLIVTKGYGQDIDSGKAVVNNYLGKYPIFLLQKTRSASVLGKNRLSIIMGSSYVWFNSRRTPCGTYQEFNKPPDYKYTVATNILVRYGWIKNHHIATGIPYIFNGSYLDSITFKNNGFGNLFIFNKWHAIHETRLIPSMTIDLWTYFPTGNAAKKSGDEDFHFKTTISISKAWRHFSLHLNPGLVLDEGFKKESFEVNAAWLFKIKKLSPVIEYNFLYEISNGASHDLDIGCKWMVLPDMVVTAGMVLNLYSSMTFAEKKAVFASVYKLF